MDYQILFNAAFAFVMLLLGWGMRVLHDAIKELRSSDRMVANKLSELSIELPKSYVSKADQDVLMNRIFDKLDRIEDKLGQVKND